MVFSFFKKQEPKQPKVDSCACPYCKDEITPVPKRKKKCPYCSKTFYPRKHYQTKEYVFLKEEELSQYENDKNHYFRAKELLRSISGVFDLSTRQTEQKVSETTKRLSEWFGQEASFPDVVWGIANEYLSKTSKSQMESLYFPMALFLHGTGRNPNDILRILNELQLKRYKKEGFIKNVEILSAGEQSCEQCQKLAGTKINIAQALKEMPLPCRECTHDIESNGKYGWCRCVYVAGDMDF